MATKSFHPTLPLSPAGLQATCDRLFTPWLRPPRRPILPVPPSLASSRLPPPAAEIDERPSYRVRRFRLWQDNAPPLRKVILDPKRRLHLRRYQTFEVPNVPTARRGCFAFTWTPPPRRTPAIPSVPSNKSATSLTKRIVSTHQPHAQTATNKNPTGLSTPLMQTPTPAPQECRPSFKPDRGTVPVRPHQLDSVSPIVPPTQQRRAPFTNQLATPINKHPPASRMGWPKLTKPERRARWQRLLQNKYILDQEHERRFRQGMASAFVDIVGFEKENVDPIRPGKGLWKEGVDTALVEQLIRFYQDIRHKSTHLFTTYHNSSLIHLVPGRDEAHKTVKSEKKAKLERKKAREARKWAEWEAAQGGNGVEKVHPIEMLRTPVQPSSALQPRQAGQVDGPRPPSPVQTGSQPMLHDVRPTKPVQATIFQQTSQISQTTVPPRTPKGHLRIDPSASPADVLEAKHQRRQQRALAREHRHTAKTPIQKPELSPCSPTQQTPSPPSSTLVTPTSSADTNTPLTRPDSLPSPNNLHRPHSHQRHSASRKRDANSPERPSQSQHPPPRDIASLRQVNEAVYHRFLAQLLMDRLKPREGRHLVSTGTELDRVRIESPDGVLEMGMEDLMSAAEIPDNPAENSMKTAEVSMNEEKEDGGFVEEYSDGSAAQSASRSAIHLPTDLHLQSDTDFESTLNPTRQALEVKFGDLNMDEDTAVPDEPESIAESSGTSADSSVGVDTAAPFVDADERDTEVTARAFEGRRPGRAVSLGFSE